MKLHRLLCTAALVLSLGAITTSAHHSFAAEFDANKPVQLRGTVAKVEWINPHTWIHIDVKDTAGTTVRWMIEGGRDVTFPDGRKLFMGSSGTGAPRDGRDGTEK
jgi:hypothetical protein